VGAYETTSSSVMQYEVEVSAEGGVISIPSSGAVEMAENKPSPR
jgi:hypothetical protein